MVLLCKRVDYAEFHDSLLQKVLIGKVQIIWFTLLLYGKIDKATFVCLERGH